MLKMPLVNHFYGDHALIGLVSTFMTGHHSNSMMHANIYLPRLGMIPDAFARAR